MKQLLALFCLTLALSACGNTPAPTAVKVGKPYTVEGQTYTPEYDPHYDRIGMASWYGPGFHGGKTANGERFDQDELTAASPTLPMPSMVRVTNLQNGESTVIRINDRGPFKDNRIIDLSRKSAKALGITGLAKVRVQYLKAETEQYWAQLHLKTDEIQFAQNDPYAPKPDENLASDETPDGMKAAQVEMPSQIKSAAPITSVSTADLKPEDLKFRPLPSHFKVVGDAQAADTPPEHTMDEQLANASPTRPMDEQVEEKTAETPVAETTVHSKIVNLTDSRGNPVGQAEHGDARSFHQDIDTSEEARPMPEPAKPVRMAAVETPRHTASPSNTGGKWFIQAGAFSSEENAHKLATRMKSIAATDVKTIEVGGKTLHRVRIGPFADRQAATKALDKAIAEGAQGAHVVGE